MSAPDEQCPAYKVAFLLNTTDMDEEQALEDVGVDPEDVMPEEDFAIGEPDCDLIDFLDGTLIRRPPRRGRSASGRRLWELCSYGSHGTPGVSEAVSA